MIPSLSGYGIGPYGLSPYGIGSVSSALGFFIENATLISANELLVTFSEPFAYGSVINPNNWDLRDDTLGQTLEIFGAQPINAYQVIVYIVVPPAPTSHDFSVGGLITSSTGNSLDPPRAPFLGINPIDAISQIGQQRRDFDFANPFLTETGQPSTLSIASSGDYDLVSGQQLILKLVIRRVITSPGEFIFLPDSYGIGLKVNVPLFISDLSRLRAQIQKSVEQEPEILAVAVGVTMDPQNGILQLNIRGKIRLTNAPFSIDVPLSSTSISFV